MAEAILGAAFMVVHLGAIFYLLLRERRQPSATLAWLLTLIFLPALGLLFYAVFGTTRARRVAKKRAVAVARVGDVVRKHAVHQKLSSPGGSKLDPRTHSLLRLGEGLTRTPASVGNQAEMLINAPQTYRSMIQAIEEARDHIHVEFFIIQPDRTGQSLRDRLTKRASEGLAVRVIYDAIGSKNLPRDFWQPLIDAGGEAAAFNPFSNFWERWRRRDRIDFRNHRKLVIVDGRIGFTGGINVGREYLGLDPERGFWRDTHIRLTGPAVLSLQQTFAEDWFTACGRLIEEPRYFPDPAPEDRGPYAVQVVDSGPDRKYPPISYFYTQCFALARDRIWLASPYLVPSPAVEQALIAAALRGVDVRILAPLKPDKRIVMLASASYFGELLEAGVRIFRYALGFMHAKTIVVDDWVGTVGSANLDMRSFHLNFELNAFVYGKEFTDAMAAQFRADLEQAQEYTLQNEKSVGLPIRLLRAGARMLSPLL